MHLLWSPGVLEEALETSHADCFSFTSHRFSSADHSIIITRHNTIRDANSILFCRHPIEIDHQVGIKLRWRRATCETPEWRIQAHPREHVREEFAFRRECFRRNKERGKGEEKGRSTRFMYDREPCGSPCDHRLTTRGTRGGMLACWRESFLHFRVSLSYPLCGYSQRCGHIRTEVILFDHHCMERYI